MSLRHFSACLFLAETPSEGTPHLNADQNDPVQVEIADKCRRIIVTAEAARAGGPYFVGTPIFADPILSCHNRQKPIGTILTVHLINNEFIAEGTLWEHLCPQEILDAPGVMGVSFDLDEVDCDLYEDGTVKIKSLVPVGATILLRRHATFKSTWVRLHARTKYRKAC